MQAIGRNDSSAVLSLVPQIASHLVNDGGTRRWQHKAVIGWLLKPNTHVDFEERLGLFLGERTSAKESGQPGATTLAWRTKDRLTSRARLPSRTVSWNLGDREFKLEETKTHEEGRRWEIVTEVEDLPRRIDFAAATLRVFGVSALDVLRFVYPEQRLILEPQVEVRGSTRMTHVSAPDFPRRLSSKKALSTLSGLITGLASDPEDEAFQKLARATRWISTVVLRWHESPAFATSMLWMALEAAFGDGYVVRGKHTGQTAQSIYMRTLQDRLADEIEAYLLRLVGTDSHQQKGLRNPPRWCVSTYLRRDDRDSQLWAREMLKAMKGYESEDPLLEVRLRELESLAEGIEDIDQDVSNDLKKLNGLRNRAAHLGEVEELEEEADYLAALACEILVIVFEDPDLLRQVG